MTQPVKLKALSIRQPYAEQILTGEKTIEYRSWCPAYRGPLLIHASKNTGEPGYKPGMVLGAILGVVLFVEAYLDEEENIVEWHLESPIRLARPVPWKGAVGIMSIPAEVVQDVGLLLPDGEPSDFVLRDYLEQAPAAMAASSA